MSILKRFSVAALPVLFSVLINRAGILDAQEPSGANQQSGQHRFPFPILLCSEGTPKASMYREISRR
jgi:hypothetical protein